MMKRFDGLAEKILILVYLGCAILVANEVPAWVEQSNQHTRLLLDILKEYNPETAAAYGLSGIDEAIIDLTPGYRERKIKAYEDARSELKKRLEQASITEVKQDIQILLMAVDETLEDFRLDEKYMLPYFNPSQSVFYSIQALLDDQITAERRPAALVRLKKYTGLAEGYEPMTENARREIEAKLNNKGLLGPVKRKIERDLDNVPRYITGIRELFDKYQITDYEDALNTLEQQVNDYSVFIQEKIVPRSRADFRLPEEMYTFNLKAYGVDMPLDEMTRRAKVSFKILQNDLTGIAQLLAAKNNWATADYREVLQLLKKQQIVGEDILPLYQQRIKELEEIARTYNIVSIPERDMLIRLASEAESAALPAPHMRPPRLIGNTGEMGEFVLPLKYPGEDLVMDDFTHEATTWTLAVHEGRPGHEMQFATIVEKGVSLARAIYAFNSVNVEGWALYMESEMKPYLPLEGQFGALQNLMIRSARAFLDPGLQSGEISQEEAMRVLREDVGLSEALAMQEMERYTFRAPGQATSYFCGYQRMLELRADVELKLGDKFDLKAFHDFVLAQGLIPPSVLRAAVFEKFVALSLESGS